MHMSRQHRRISFLFMSERDDTCMAFRCCEPRQSTGAEFCGKHQGLMDEFRHWLAGADDGGCPVARAFDAERGTWSAQRRTA
jgi:hypothetical protein